MREKNTAKKVSVVQSEEETVLAQVLATSIRRLGESVAAFDKAGLSEKAIVLLLQNASGESKTATQNVLWGLRNLERLYLKPKVGR